MDILILGNGFDLAHGLKTRYTDFLDYWKKDKNVENVWLKHFVNRQKQLGDKWIDLEEEIYNVIKEINKNLKDITDNYRYNSLSKLCSFKKDYTDEKFDLSKINKYFKIPIRIVETDEKEYGIIGQFYYFKTYKGLINFLYDQLRDFTKQFKKYLSLEFLNNLTIKKYNFKLSKNKIRKVLNFNYTSTYKLLYDQYSIDSKYVYIHGRVLPSSDCELVLGTQSFSNEEINVEFNVFKKHNQRHRYGTIEAYQDLLKELNDKRRIINPVFHVIGHSLDKADHNILRHIFKVRENSTINIYYHNQEALERLINNITEIIGEEEVMAKVRFIHQEDPNRGILIPKK